VAQWAGNQCQSGLPPVSRPEPDRKSNMCILDHDHSHAFPSRSLSRDAEAHLALLASDPAALPDRHSTTTAAGNLSLKKFTKGELADLYKQLVAGLVLATAKEAFAVAPRVTEIRIVSLRNTPADAYGKVRPKRSWLPELLDRR
jgi:hypothetical protein